MTMDAAERARIAALIAVQEGRSVVPLLDDSAITALLATHPRIALVGASDRPGRPAHETMAALLRLGVDVVPVNPALQEVLGRPCFPTVAAAVAATGPVDIVDVFRRPEFCAEHALDAVAAGATCLWLQLGIVDEEAGRIAHAAGIGVVMDRCTLIEFHRRGLGRAGAGSTAEQQ
jgi:predicted CoA-binding protein